MKDYLKPRVIKLTFIINILFLFWHAVLLALCGYKRIWILAGFNIFSVLVYIYTLIALKKQRPHGVIRLMYVELLFHMIISVVCVGWNCGFQAYAFGILPIVIFGDYIENDSRLRFRSYAMAASVIVSYLLLGIWTNTHAPLYTFATERGTRLFGIINGTATVAAVSVYYLLFTYIVFSFERGLIHDASYDSLTGLANRRVLYEQREKIQQTEDYCVFMIDVDGFKHINDTYGHTAGDRVLERIGELLTECRYTMNDFLPVRWGGEEFVVVYYDADIGQEEKIRQMEKIRQRIGELCVTMGQTEIHFTVTVGAAADGEDGTLDGLVVLADSRMYYGKGHGKNCLVFAHDEWRNIG